MINFKITGEPNAVMVFDPLNHIYFFFIGLYSDDDDLSDLYLYTHCDGVSRVKVATDSDGRVLIKGVDEIC